MSAIEIGLKKLADKERAKVNSWFFKTEKGAYGEGDKFLGARLPQIRKLIKINLKEASLAEAVDLLKSPWHEIRLAGCILMVELRKKAVKDCNKKDEEAIYKAYLKNTKRINNWDMVDVSAGEIVGNHLLDGNRSVLRALAESKSLWERRIAIVSTWAFIKNGEYQDTFFICSRLLGDKQDLIHKACGWMLREVGKNCGQKILNGFLDKHASIMPRVMLRYSLEKHNKRGQKKYMSKAKQF